MRTIKALAALLALCLPATAMAAQPPQPAPDARWSPFLHSEKGQIFLDRASLQRDGNLRTIVVRAIPAMPDGEMTTAEVLMRFNCTERTYALLHLKALRNDGSQVLETDNPAGNRLEPIGQEPDTVALFEGVCAL